MSKPIVVPPDALSPDALAGLVEEFITREGTDYGAREHSLDEKRAEIMRQLRRADIAILFDPDSESTTLITRDELARSDVAAD
jgi:uncharacterized protein